MKTLVLSLLSLAGLGLLAPHVALKPEDRAKSIATSFKPFEPKVKTRHDEKFFYVESDGIPDHELMVGITAWQQQVPIPQPYIGANAWRFPLFPEAAEKPMSAKTGFFRGAIAIAANGIPIFNPIKNDGRTDTNLAGELDQFGGHGGRSDDYHYHLAPLHLVSKLGEDKPIAYALDGYGIYGLKCEGGQAPADLDAFNGHSTRERGYHYHATKTYPYLNGGFHGHVTEREGQVDPQPRAVGVRPALPPLRGAKITGFKREGAKTTLTYTLAGATHTVSYAIGSDGKYTFVFTDPDGKSRTEVYDAPRSGGRRGDFQGGRGGQPAAQDEDQPRKPWIVAHGKELDTNGDGAVTLGEINALVDAAWKEVAGGQTSLKIEELISARPARNVIGGYLKGHAKEFDASSDGAITLDEVKGEFSRLLHRADTDHDHQLSGKEVEG